MSGEPAWHAAARRSTGEWEAPAQGSHRRGAHAAVRTDRVAGARDGGSSSSMVLLVLLGFAVVALAHTAPAPFVLDAMAGDTAVWHMPRGHPPTVYLTFD